MNPLSSAAQELALATASLLSEVEKVDHPPSGKRMEAVQRAIDTVQQYRNRIQTETNSRCARGRLGSSERSTPRPRWLHSNPHWSKKTNGNSRRRPPRADRPQSRARLFLDATPPHRCARRRSSWLVAVFQLQDHGRRNAAHVRTDEPIRTEHHDNTQAALIRELDLERRNSRSPWPGYSYARWARLASSCSACRYWCIRWSEVSISWSTHS